MKLFQRFLPKQLQVPTYRIRKENTREGPEIIVFARPECAWLTQNGEKRMIEVTKLNEEKILVNADLIESVEETPDTVLSLSTGRKIIVKESRQEVRNLVILYKRECYGDLGRLLLSEERK